jgi:hypothetical protein
LCCHFLGFLELKHAGVKARKLERSDRREILIKRRACMRKRKGGDRKCMRRRKS